MFSPETVRPLQLTEHKRTNRDTTLALLLHTAGEGAETRSGEEARGSTHTHTHSHTHTHLLAHTHTPACGLGQSPEVADPTRKLPEALEEVEERGSQTLITTSPTLG